MNRRDFQRAFGDAPEDFHLRLQATLDGLEEKNMKKKYKFSTALIAAVLMIAILTGAGIAAGQLGIFDFLKTADPIVPLPGAEELVATNLGTVENDLAVLTVEEAVFDGQGVLVQMRLTPKDENHVMYNAFSTDSPLAETKLVPMKMAEGTHELGDWTIVNEDGDRRLLKDGIELSIPTSAEEAHEKDLPVYLEDGILYDAMGMDMIPVAKEDGYKLMDYWTGVRVEIEGLPEMEQPKSTESGSDEGQEDGSVIIRTSYFADEPLNVESVRIHCSARVSEGSYDEGLEMEGIDIVLPKSGETRKVKVLPVGDGKGERFEILPSEIVFTKVRGYFELKYKYQQAASGEEMGIDFRIFDANGNRITTGGGSGWEEDGIYGWSWDMQSFEEIPETIFLEAKVIGEDKTLGRVECKLVEE